MQLVLKPKLTLSQKSIITLSILYTSPFQGTGMGLFISKSVIVAHGGNMWARSNEDGKGTTFSFSLLLGY